MSEYLKLVGMYNDFNILQRQNEKLLQTISSVIMHINLIIQNQKKTVLKGAKILYQRSIVRKARKTTRNRKTILVPAIVKSLVQLDTENELKGKKMKRKVLGKSQ